MDKFKTLFIQTFVVCLLIGCLPCTISIQGLPSLVGPEVFAQEAAAQVAEETTEEAAPETIVKGLPVSLKVKLSGSKIISEGEIRNIAVDIRNHSDRIIILYRLEAKCGAERGLEEFLYSISGLLHYDEVQDSYYYNSLVQEQTPAVFVQGLLLPDQTMQSVIPIKILDGSIKLSLNFYSFTLDDLAQTLYFPSETVELVETKFAHLARAKIKNIFDDESYKFIQIIFREDSRFRFKYFTQKTELTLDLKRFSYNDALRRIQARSSDPFTYFNLAGGWVIEKRERPFLVKKDQIRPYPKMDFSIFKYVDEMQDLKGAITLTLDKASHSLLETDYAMKAIEKVKYFEDVPYILELPKADFLEFLNVCYSKNLRLNLKFYAAGKWRIDVR